MYRLCAILVKAYGKKAGKKVKQRGIEKGILASVQNLMESTGWTVDEAMKALRIPDTDRPIFRAKIQQ